MDNKTWLKVSQYLDMEKGEYFKENSRMKQMSELKEFDEFNFKNYDNSNNNNEKENDEGPSNIFYEENNEVGTSLDKINYMNPIENVDYNNMNMSSNNFYNELDKRESSSSLLYNNNNNNNMNNINNNIHKKYNGSDIKNNDSFYKSNLSSPIKENRMSFENSYETFFEKESDISDTEVSDVWEKERLQRIKERKEYEEKEKKEIKKKAAQDLKKWYEEIAIVIEEKKFVIRHQSKHTSYSFLFNFLMRYEIKIIT
ncbi:hypothetical protein PFTANZ_05322 [Plasmodium falciparum Tanzania (2000708)]|uniref:Uncharacterized protein n=1 Tax=Plasmodium falciparum Tanzania (2000708) TaxID=1036725 RepID=A0A024W1E8_PLAFA|nr:hypothetical protein PFTANZ_05322 [Plasmodium falciparum Tanzania (2000708)]